MNSGGAGVVKVRRNSPNENYGCPIRRKLAGGIVLEQIDLGAREVADYQVALLGKGARECGAVERFEQPARHASIAADRRRHGPMEAFTKRIAGGSPVALCAPRPDVRNPALMCGKERPPEIAAGCGATY